MKEHDCQNDEVNLLDYMKVIIRQRKIIIGIFVVCVGIAILANFLTPVPDTTYEINSTIRIGSIQGSLLTANEAIEKLKNRNVLLSVISEIGVDIDVDDLKNALNITKISETNFLRLQMHSTKPDMAVKMLNNIEDKFISGGNKHYEKNIKVLKEQVQSLSIRKEILSEQMKILNQKIIDNKSQLDYLQIIDSLTKCEQIYRELETAEDSLQNILFTAKNFEIIEPPAKSIIPAPPQKKKQKVVIAAILGLMLGLLVAFFKDFWQRNAAKLTENS